MRKASLLIFVLVLIAFVYANSFSDLTQSNFNNGTYANTFYNGSAVVLSGANLTGNFTSRVFDAGANANWNNITFNFTTPVLDQIYAVDNQADVWKSIDSGASWTLVKDGYNAGESNDVTDIFYINNKTLYIVVTQRVWASGDSGVSWTKVNDDYNGAEGQNSFVAIADKNDNLYILEGDQDVWKSTNLGSSWTKVSTDFNGGNGNIFGIIVNSSNSIFVVDNQADVWKSIDSGASWTLVKDDYNAGTGNNADDMTIDKNNNIYILDLQDVWKSVDSGVLWTKVNDDFNGAEDSNNGQSITIDSLNNIYIIDGSEDVFQSLDGGSTFTRVAIDFNGGNGQVPTMISILKTTNITFQVKNCSLIDCSDGSWQVSSGLENDLNLTGRYFQYRTFFTSTDSSITPQLNSVNLDYTLINSAPTISIVSPQNGATYGTNTSLQLNYIVSDAENNLAACWWNIDSGTNSSITCGQNTTFSTSSGNHIIAIYANDSYGLASSSSSSFNINIGAPTISNLNPGDVYLNYNLINFSYYVSDSDLQSCELWGNFSGAFSLNQTNNNPLNYSYNNFTLNLSDGTYLWNVRCNDSQGRSSFNGNKTFTIDTTSPVISLTEPNGAKSSRTGIPLAFSVNESNKNSCWYNVYRGTNFEIANKTLDCNLNSTTFDVTIDADFILNFYTNDSAGNLDNKSSVFSVLISSGGNTFGTGGTGGGGGGGRTIIQETNGTTELGVSEIDGIIGNAGDVKKLSWKVKNTGTTFLNGCKFGSYGDYASWISGSETKNLASGEEYNFVFDVKIPESVNGGDYLLGISLDCNEISKSSALNIEVLNKKLNFEFKDVERISKGQIKVYYSLKELSGTNQDVKIQFLLFDSSNAKVAEAQDEAKIQANSVGDFDALINIDESLEGELKMLVNMNSEEYSSFFQENVILGAPTGFAIFGQGTNDKLISSVLIILFLLFAFFIIKRILSHRKQIKFKNKIKVIKNSNKGKIIIIRKKKKRE